jgi:hypothetical protein
MPNRELFIHRVDVDEDKTGSFGNARGTIWAEGLIQLVQLARHEKDPPGTYNVVDDGFIMTEDFVFCGILDQFNEPESPSLACYCLQLGVRGYDESFLVFYLLLERLSFKDEQPMYRRIGLAYRDRWGLSPLDNVSDIFTSGEGVDLCIV